MAVSSGFFDSIEGDRLYDAAQMSNYFDGLVSNGIYESIGDKFIVQAAGGMNVTVGTGRALIKCRWIKSDSPVTIAIDPADVSINRIDAIVLRLDLTELGRSITIEVKKGTEELTVPEIVQTDEIYELCIACVKVGNNTTQITQNLIIDMRSSSYCGWVTGLIKQVDTSELFLQFQTAYENYYAESTAAFDAYMQAKMTEFNAWFSSLTTTLNVDTTITKYTNSVTEIGTTSEVSIGIPEYDSGSDVIFVYINGIHMTEGVEYIASGSGDTAKITLSNAVSGNNTFTFDVLKNVIGRGVIGIGETISDTDGTTDSMVGIAQEEE